MLKVAGKQEITFIFKTHSILTLSRLLTMKREKHTLTVNVKH
jgi:hypothetical protein